MHQIVNSRAGLTWYYCLLGATDRSRNKLVDLLPREQVMVPVYMSYEVE